MGLTRKMPAVWSTTTPISVLLSQSRQSCHPLEWSRKDPTPRPCLAEAARVKNRQLMHRRTAVANNEGTSELFVVRESAPRSALQQIPFHRANQPLRYERKAAYEHTPMCILPRMADGTRPVTIAKSLARELAEQTINMSRVVPNQAIAENRFANQATLVNRPQSAANHAPNSSLRLASPPAARFEAALQM